MATPPDATGSGSASRGEVIEVDGLLWKPRPEASSSSDEFRRARSLILEIDRDASWNPWVRGPRAGVRAGSGGLRAVDAGRA